jgi:hypothetical protein
MLVEAIELIAERIIPGRWEAYQQARYDYEGWVSENEVSDYSGAEMWCKSPGKRFRSVCVVVKNGRRMRVW